MSGRGEAFFGVKRRGVAAGDLGAGVTLPAGEGDGPGVIGAGVGVGIGVDDWEIGGLFGVGMAGLISSRTGAA